MLNPIFHFTNEIKCIAFFKGLKILSLSIWMLAFWFCSSFSSGKGKRQELCTGSPLLSWYVSWHFSGMNYENPKPISLLLCALSCSILRWSMFCSCLYLLVKIVLVTLLLPFLNMKLTAIILPVFTRKAFSKRELLIIKCFNSEKEAKIHAQETVDKNEHTKTTKWVPTAVADWVSFWERSRFQPKCTFPFQWFLHKKLLWYSSPNHLRLKFLFLF